MSGACALRLAEPVCTNGALTDPCGEDADCKPGLCMRVGATGRCVDGAIGSPCAQGDDCTGNMCVPDVGYVDGALGSPCGGNSQCESLHCAFAAGAGHGQCTSGELDQPCDADGGPCFLDGDCVTTVHCVADASSPTGFSCAE